MKEKPLNKYLGKGHCKSVMASAMPLTRNKLGVLRGLKTRGGNRREIENSGSTHNETWIVFCNREAMYIFDRRAK